jgi:hypothetical protein
MKCEILEFCPFYNERMQYLKSLSNKLKDKYCLGDKTICARYIMYSSLGKAKVPEDLYPFQIDIAKKLVEAEKK